MHANRIGLRIVLVLAATFAIPILGQVEETPTKRLLKANEGDQIAWLRKYISDGAPPDDIVGILVLSKPSVFLPWLEEKIEDILHSPSPGALFNSKSADPQRAVDAAASMIEYSGDEQGLREASKLMKLDETRFGGMVGSILWHARARGNPFKLVYRGFEIGDPSVDKRIVAWIGELFDYKEIPDRNRTMASWAEAMVEKYDGQPTAIQWATDPIASRLDPTEDAALHNEMSHFTEQAVQKRLKK
jgi:hypothetical protein